MLRCESYAIGSLEPCQVGNQAALRDVRRCAVGVLALSEAEFSHVGTRFDFRVCDLCLRRAFFAVGFSRRFFVFFARFLSEKTPVRAGGCNFRKNVV